MRRFALIALGLTSLSVTACQAVSAPDRSYSLGDGVVSYDDLRQLFFQNPAFGFYFLRLTTGRLFDNLTRLGLIWQSPEPLRDLLRYQVVEAQPDVLAAKHSVRRAIVVRRSIHLTPFGSDFTRICFATEGEAVAGLFPSHDAPPEAVMESVLDD